MNDLTERLRKGCVIDCETDRFGVVNETETNSLLDEAANEIERLASELKALKESRDSWMRAATRLHRQAADDEAESRKETE